MRLGIGSYTYTWSIGVRGHAPEHPMTALELLRKAAELGVQVVQFADNLPLDSLPEQELEAVRSRANDLGISVEVGTRGLAPDHLRRYIALAVRFGSPILRIIVDTVECKPAVEEVVATLRQLSPELKAARVCVAIENHDRLPARVLARMVGQIGSPNVGICLDTVNSFGALEGPEAVLDALGPWVVNLHIKDFAVERAGHMMGFVVEGRPAGRGRLDVPWLLRTLRALGRDPNAILELWTPPEPTLAATIAKEDQWAADSIRYLKTLC